MVEMKNINSVSDRKDLSEKAFLHSIAISIIGMIFCMIALCSTTWAWFNEGVASSSNVIKSGNCDMAVSVTTGGATVSPASTNTEQYTFEKGKTYVISITSVGSSSSYCKLEFNGGEYYTQQIAVSESGTTISFELTFDDDTEVKILTRWGIYRDKERDFINGQSYQNPSKESK